MAEHHRPAHRPVSMQATSPGRWGSKIAASGVMFAASRGVAPAAESAGVHRHGGNRGLGDDVVDGDVDGDVAEPGFGAYFGDGSLLDFAGDCVESAAVLGGNGEVDHGGAAQNASCRVWVVVPEGRFLGWACGCAVDAAAEGGLDTLRAASRAIVATTRAATRMAPVPLMWQVYQTSAMILRIWLATAVFRVAGTATCSAARLRTGSQTRLNSFSAASQ